MTTPGFYDDRETSAKGVAEHAARKAQVAELMGRWEEMQAALDALTSRAGSAR